MSQLKPTQEIFRNGQNTSSRKEGSESPRQEGSWRRRQETHQESRVLLNIHLQSAEAGSPQHRHLKEGHVHPQLVH